MPTSSTSFLIDTFPILPINSHRIHQWLSMAFIGHPILQGCWPFQMLKLFWHLNRAHGSPTQKVFFKFLRSLLLTLLALLFFVPPHFLRTWFFRKIRQTLLLLSSSELYFGVLTEKTPEKVTKYKLTNFLFSSRISTFTTSFVGYLRHFCRPWWFHWIHERMYHYRWAVLSLWCRSKQGQKDLQSMTIIQAKITLRYC